MNAKDIPRQFTVEQVIKEHKRSRLLKEILDHRAGIYAIVNRRNKNTYVGQTVDLLKRKTDHFKLLAEKKHHNKHLQNAYNLYGSDVFAFVVLEYVRVYAELTEREQFWIDTLKPVYNIVVDVISHPWPARCDWEKTVDEEPFYTKDGESFTRPEWHKWVYGGEKNPLLLVGKQPSRKG